MTRLALSIFLFIALSSTALAEEHLSTESTFQYFEGQSKYGLLFGRFGELTLDKSLAIHHMREVSRLTPPLSDGGNWVTTDDVGSVSLRIQRPSLLHSDIDEASVTFSPQVHEPIPQAVLAHLFTTASHTTLTGATTIELSFTPERTTPSGRCWMTRLVTIRLTTGSLVMNRVDTTCERTPSDIRPAKQ